MSDKLKPCPFCGEPEPSIEYDEKTYLHPHWMIMCDCCLCSTSWHSQKDSAIGIWNTRERANDE